jgi:hypothetical protein
MSAPLAVTRALQRSVASLMGFTRAIFLGDVWAAHEYRETVARIVVADARSRRGKRPPPASEFLQGRSAPLQTPRPHRPPPPPTGEVTQAVATVAAATVTATTVKPKSTRRRRSPRTGTEASSMV